MGEYQPRSVRLGLRTQDGPFPGLPPHIRDYVVTWVDDNLRDYKARPDEMALSLRISIGDKSAVTRMTEIVKQYEWYKKESLDVVEATMHFIHRPEEAAANLRWILAKGGSVYTVSPDFYLVDVVSEALTSSLESAVSRDDEAADHISTAWREAYGRDPDPSDAWDHAIKAVESILVPALFPGDKTKTLGSVRGQLKSQQQGLYEFALPDRDVSALVGILGCIWGNPDRHSPTDRKPSLEEARVVVSLAASIVQIERDFGWVARRKGKDES